VCTQKKKNMGGAGGGGGGGAWGVGGCAGGGGLVLGNSGRVSLRPPAGKKVQGRGVLSSASHQRASKEERHNLLIHKVSIHLNKKHTSELSFSPSTAVPTTGNEVPRWEDKERDHPKGISTGF